MTGARAHLVPHRRAGRRPRPGPAGPGRHGGPGRRQADRLGGRHAARQPHRDAGVTGHRPGAVRGGRRARPDHHLRRDLPRSRARPGACVHQSRRARAGAHRGDHRAEQEPGRGRLADRRGPAARRRRPPGRRPRSTGCASGCSASAARSGPRRRARSRRPPRYAFGEPPELVERVARSRRLHATVARAVAARFPAAGVAGPVPQAAFYLYPDFGPWREQAARRHGVSTGPGLAALLLDRYGAGVLPASAFGEDRRAAGCGWRPGCSTADTTSSARPRWPHLTRWRCPGSRPRWPGSRRSWPTWAAERPGRGPWAVSATGLRPVQQACEA